MSDPNNDTITVAIITSFIGPIMVILGNLWINKIIKYIESKKSEKSHLVDDSINEKLSMILSQYNADRVNIVKFHNGQYYNSGVSMRRFSMAYEVVQTGISSDLHMVQNLPIEPFSQCFAAAREMGINKYIDLPAETQLNCGEFACSHHKKISCNYRNFLFWRGIYSAYLFPLIDIKGKFIGILQVKSVRRILALTDKQIEEIADISRTIAGALSK